MGLNFPQLARLVVKLMALDEGPWYLTLDRTNWRFGKHEINILMLGIAYRGVAIPLLWTLLPKAGNSNTAERIALMERFLALFGRERIAALLADREFVGQAWFEYLQRQGIAFRIRIKHNTLIPNRWNNMLRASVLFSSLQPGEHHVLAGRRPVWGCFVHILALRLDNRELLILVTTDTPEQALADYARRWEIGVSGEGHIVQSVKVRPRLTDSGLVAWEAPWRESKTVKPSDNVHPWVYSNASGCNVQ